MSLNVFPNYYDILGIQINASQNEISQAMQKFMQNQPKNDETLEILRACKNHLLHADNRKQYNRELLLAYPELLDKVMQQVEKTQVQPQTEQPTESKAIRQPQARSDKNHSPSQSEEGSEKRGCADFVSLIVTGLVCSAIFATCKGGGGGGSSKPAALDEWSAQVACENAVEERLKAPATADFGGWVRTNNYNQTFTVTGYVDAQNSFGAKIRTQFSCTVRDNGNATTSTSVILNE